mgnify:CR=1 FL=1
MEETGLRIPGMEQAGLTDSRLEWNLQHPVPGSQPYAAGTRVTERTPHPLPESGRLLPEARDRRKPHR